MRVGLFICLALFSFSALAVEPADDETPLDELLEEADAEADEGAEDKSWVDAHKNYVDTQIERASMWVDSFFVDSEYEAEDAYSQIRLRPEFYSRKEQGAKGKFRFRARVNLPNLGRKVSLVAGADDDSGFDDSVDDSGDEGILGLHFFGKQNSKWNTSFTVGM